jgi:hypothetical protein
MAYLKPACTAPPIPRLNGSRSTLAPASCAIRAVASVEPSSTTSTSYSGAFVRRLRTTSPTDAASLYDGTTASFLGRLTMEKLFQEQGGGTKVAQECLPALATGGG